MSLFPKIRTALARAIAPEYTRRFEAAGGGRRFASTPNYGSHRVETALASTQLRSRARHLAVNNPWASNGIEALVTALVGTGIVPASGEKSRAARRKLQSQFRSWAKTCDADGLTDYWGIQAQAARALVVDGEAFIQMIESDTGLSLRLIPSEMIQSASASATIDPLNVAGIQFDAEGKRVSYSVRKNPNSTKYVIVPASDMIHLFMPLGAGQVRGTSWLASVILKLADLDLLDDALLKGFQVSALHAGYVTNLGSDGALPFDGQQTGSTLDVSLEPGTVKVLPMGTDIKFNSPMQAQQGNEFISAQLRAVAAGLHVPEFLLSGDLRGANYSSMRSALISFRQYIERIQYQILIPQMLDRIWNRVMFAENDLTVEHYTPALPWVDPLKDVEAVAAEIDAGLISRRQAVARRGYDIEELDDEIAADRDREKILGLSFEVQPATGKQQNAPAQQPN
jgi:lambda family phage portal protein